MLEIIRVALMLLSVGFLFAGQWHIAMSSEGLRILGAGNATLASNRRMLRLARSGERVEDPEDAERVRSFLSFLIGRDKRARTQTRIGQVCFLGAAIVGIFDSEEGILAAGGHALLWFGPFALIIVFGEWLHHRYWKTAEANGWIYTKGQSNRIS